MGDRIDGAQSSLGILQRFVDRGERRAVAFVDLRSGARLDIRGDRLMPAASVAKVGLVATVYRLAAEGALDLGFSVPAGEVADTIYPTVLRAFAGHEQLTLANLAALALITSDNPAAHFLHQLVGLQEVLLTLRILGAPSARYISSFADDDLGASNRRNQISAKEALALVLSIEADPIYFAVAEALRNNVRSSRIPLYLPEETAVMHKTGTLERVANDVAVIRGQRCSVGLAFFCDRETDRVEVERDIGQCTAEILAGYNEPLDLDPPAALDA